MGVYHWLQWSRGKLFTEGGFDYCAVALTGPECFNGDASERNPCPGFCFQCRIRRASIQDPPHPLCIGDGGRKLAMGH